MSNKSDLTLIKTAPSTSLPRESAGEFKRWLLVDVRTVSRATAAHGEIPMPETGRIVTHRLTAPYLSYSGHFKDGLPVSPRRFGLSE